VICALSGGTGGTKMVDGLAQVVGQENLVAIVNTADDDDFFGLRVCPDLDICTYTLAGVVSERGWGWKDDSFRCLEGLATYGRPAWFGIGDRDLATHIHRTLRMGEGWPLHRIVDEIRQKLGVQAKLLPMTDDPVRTRIVTPDGPRRFQEYLIQHGAGETIDEIDFEGIDAARPAPGVLDAIADAELVVICPSSPVVSIGTILGVPGVRDAVAARRDRCVAVSPIVGRRPVEGPADRFLAGAGHSECSSTQMARLYADVASVFLLDMRDADEADDIAALGLRPVVTDILMPDRDQRARLAGEVLAAMA
jgi:LPPG:FO 2-phospho-L-lactate transferase